MKKISFIFFIVVLMIMLFTSIAFATEENPQETVENVETTENVETISEEENKIKVVNSFGKVVEDNGVKEVTTGTIVDKVQEVVIAVTEGEYKGEEYVVEYMLSYDLEGKMLMPELRKGDIVEIQIAEEQDTTTTVTIVEISRTKHLIILSLIFIISFFVICGKSGIRTIISLIFSVIFIYGFMFIKIANGFNIIIVALISTFAVVFIMNVIKHGMNKKAISATIGIFCGVIISGILSLVFTKYAKLTGAYEIATNISANLADLNINFKNLIFASTLISATGICMSIGEAIVNNLEEIKMKDSEIAWKELFKKGIKDGRKYIEENSSVLIMFTLGIYLSFIVILISSNMNLVQILSKEQIAEVIILPIIGMVGAVYTIPVTSIAYSFLNKDKLIYKRSADNKLGGKRSLKI